MKPVRLSLRDMRADALHRLLLSPRGAGVRDVDDIHRLEDLGSWHGAVLDAAVDDLVAAGTLEQDAHGQLIIRELA